MNGTRFNPFPGLRPFRMEEKYLFFGREEQTVELLQRLRQTRFLAVVGTSGSGKSSLVQAGLLPELYGGTMLQAGSRWQVVVMRPGGNPLTHLAEALVAADLYDPDREDVALEVRATLSRSGLGLLEAARQSDLRPGTNLLVVVDQFEEIFRFRRSGTANKDEAAAFVNLLLEASRQNEAAIYIALTMRSDYLGDCSEFPDLAEAVNEGEYLIPRLSREQKRAAIAGPVKVGGGSIAPRLLQKLLNDVGDNPDHLPVLQHALMRTWDAWMHDQADGEPIDLRHYRAVGGIAEALSRHADEVFEELPDDRHRAVAEKVFKALTERSIDNRGIRRPGTVRRLRAIADTDETTLRSAMDPFRRFGRTFLMPSEEAELTPVTVIDISHESLMRVWTRLDQWVEDEAQSARIYWRLADTAALYAAGKSALYHDPDLQIAESWRRDEHPNEAWANQYGGRFSESMAFLDESARTARLAEDAAESARRRELEQAKALAEAQRQRVAEQAVAARRLKRLLAIAATVAVLAAVASAFAILQRSRARTSEKAAQTSEQAVQGLASQLKNQLVRGDIGVADEKLRRGEASTGLAHLARAMRTDPTVSAAGFRALSLLAGGALPTQRFPDIAHEKPIGTFLYNPENDLLFTSSEEGREAGLWDLRTGERRFSFHGAYAVVPMVGSGGLPAPALPPGGVPRWVDVELRDSRWILHHADDPANPGLDPRYYRKVVPLTDYGEIVRAEIFLRVDDEFTLTEGGEVVGDGNRWDYFHYADLSARLEGKDSLLIEVEARNRLATAGIVGTLRLTDRDGKRHLVPTDATWQSSDRRDGSFADTQALGGPTDWFEGEGRMSVVAPRWSQDRKRLVFLTLPQWTFRALDVETLEFTEAGVDASGLRGTPVNEINEDISAFDGQGDVVAFTNRSGAVELWNLTTGRAVAPPLRGLGSIMSWQFTPDGRRLAALGSDLAIYLWNALDGSLVRKIVSPAHPEGGNPGLGGFVISPDGKYLFAPASSGTLLNVWNIAEPGAEEPSDWLALPEGFSGVQEIRFIAGEALMAVIGLRTVGEEESHVFARTFDLETREVRADIDCGKVVPGIAMMTQWSAGSKSHRMSMDSAGAGLTYQLRDSAAAAVGGFGLVGVVSDRQVAVWDLRGGESIARFTAPEPLYSVGLAPDGRTLVAGSVVWGASAPAISGSTAAEVGAKKLYVYDLFTTRAEALPVPIPLSGNAVLQFSPDGATMVTMVIGDDRAQFWDLQTGRQVRNPVPGKSIGHCIFSDKGDRVAFFQGESTFRGDRSIGLNRGRFTLHQTALPPAIPESLTESGAWPSVRGVPGAREWLTFDRPGKGGLGRVRSWDAQANTVIRSVDVEIDERSPNFAVDWSSDGSRLVYKKSENHEAVILEVATGSPLGGVAMENALFVAGMSGNGKVAALGDAGGGGKIWREGGDVLAFHPFGGRDSIETVRLNEGGSLVAVGSTNNRAFAIVDTETGKAIYGPETLPNPLADALFLPDGRRVVVSATDYTVLVIDVTTGETVQRIPVEEWSRELALSPDGRTLAIGSNERVYLWNLEAGAMAAAPFNLPGSAHAHRLRFSDDGTLLAVGTRAALGTGDAGVFQIVEVATGTALNEPLTRRSDVVSLAFQGDASAVAVGWGDGVIQTLPLPTFGRVPAWLPDLVESIAGARLGQKTGILEPVEEAGLVTARGKFGGSAELEPDGWATWARWLFEDPATRGISPGAQTTVAEYVGRLRESGTTADLREAVRMTPNDALAVAWLAVRLGEEFQSRGFWSSGYWKETVVRWSDRALRLEPENGEVWALRAEMFQRIGRPEQAEVAARRAQELVESGATPASPNIDFEMALALAANGEAAAADAAFAEALAKLGARGGTSAAGRGPLPAVLARVKSAAGGQTGPRREVRLPDPIPGAFEDFEGVSEGSLPAGWTVRNASDASWSAGQWNLNDPQSDAFKDWVVVSRDRFLAAGGPDAPPKLADPPNHFLNGKPARLLSGNFLLAQSDGRRGVQIQYLFTPDFDCTGHQGVHVAFHSVYTQNSDATAALEFSTDGGSAWKPVVYRLVGKDVLRKPDGEVDAVGTFTEIRRQTPRHRDADGRLRGLRHGDFIGAEVTPGLASRIESGTDDDQRQFKRIEVYRLEGADGEPRVRFRMALAGSNSWHWMLDRFGLYSIPGGEPVLGDEDAPPRGTEITAVPASDHLLEIAEDLLKSPSAPSSLAALLLARRAAADSPGESRALDLQARALCAAAARHSSRTVGDNGLSEALACARLAIGAHPEIGSYWETLARIYLQMGREKLAGDRRDEATLYFETADALVGWLGKRGTDLQQEIGAALVGVGRMDVPQILFPDWKGVVSRWKFLDNGSDQGDAWTLPDFDDSGWRVGPAPLGYGDDGEVTRVAAGPDDAKFVTTYFRTEFTVPDAGAISGLQLQLLRDDGAVVYLNGEEIARDNLPTGAIRFDTLATATVAEDKEGADIEGTLVPILASSGALRSGRNVIAAEVHQVSRTSTDLAFNLQVDGVGLAAAKLPPASELDRLETTLEIPADLRFLLWTARARLLQDAGLAERAGEARERALAIQPENPAAGWLEARAAAGSGDSEAAYAAYRKAAEGALALATSSADARRLFLPPGLWDLGSLASRAPASLAQAGLRRSREADTDRNWELRQLDRWLEEIAPGDSAAMRKRVAFLTAAGEFARASNLLEALERESPSDLGLDAVGIRERRELLALRENLLRATGRGGEAETVKQAILAAPPRAPGLDARLLDLTPYYNASLYDGRGWEDPVLNLGALPESFQGQDEIAFDLRGIIQLGGTSESISSYPRRVEGIRVDAKAAAIHFLLAACRGGDTQPGSETGAVVFHYSDGSSATLPLIDQENISDYWIYDKHTIDPRRIAWTAPNTGPRNEPFQLIHAVWQNPHPERAIASLDLVSAMRTEAPFFVAITLE